MFPRNVPTSCPTGKFKPRLASFQPNFLGNAAGKPKPKELCVLPPPTQLFLRSDFLLQSRDAPLLPESTSRSPCPGAGDTCPEGRAWMLHPLHPSLCRIKFTFPTMELWSHQVTPNTSFPHQHVPHGIQASHSRLDHSLAAPTALSLPPSTYWT